MARIGPIMQNWEPIVILKKALNATAKKDEKAVNAVQHMGVEIETLKKSNIGSNKEASSSTTLNTRKLKDKTESLFHDKVLTELKKNIIQARIDKKLN
ncbi:hypothetical protein IEQ34_005510 [Dendrobium chrysotoxum]|uniref:Multiprotein bridging factor 1 N-terminal domain-containing protein n=1 Tax=Dendrobium chrysotoxum TaxID=161865 RepID=A0AAV7HC21_DENCH|nr:hypothetical protein IEQ34_005510 [Dendrobium chrysotoxum]